MDPFFSPDKKVFTAQSPGRLDVMGGISDYSGSLLLQMPVKQITTVKLQIRMDGVLHLRTLNGRNSYHEFIADVNEIPFHDLRQLHNYLKNKPDGAWGAYVVGCFALLCMEKSIPITGASVLIESSLPWGKGVSSSAALEVATIHAICQAAGIQPGRIELPILAQRVENEIVGAACGLMDQLSVQLGEKNKLLPLRCQPHDVFESVRIPSGISFPAIDSGVRHAVGGSSYSEVRTACFMAYTLIALQTGTPKEDLMRARDTGLTNLLPFGGYLSNIPVSVFESRYADLLPETLDGAAFLKKYQVSIDRATTVDPARTYQVRSCARHPIYENHRVQNFLTLLEAFPGSRQKENLLKLMGEYMYQSHAGYSSVGLGNSITDEIVNAVREKGPEAGLFGARVSGGGSGGTVVILSYGSEGIKAARDIFKQFQKKQKQKLFFFHGSNHGALSLNR